MPDVDGKVKIKIGSTIDTRQVEQELKGLKDTIQKSANIKDVKIKGLNIDYTNVKSNLLNIRKEIERILSSSGKNKSTQMLTLESQLKTVFQQAVKLDAEMVKLGNTKFPTQIFLDVTKDLQKATATAEKLGKELKEVQAATDVKLAPLQERLDSYKSDVARYQQYLSSNQYAGKELLPSQREFFGNQISNYQQEIANIQREMAQIRKSSGLMDLQTQWNTATQAVKGYEAELAQLKQTGFAYEQGTDTQEYENKKVQLDAIKDKLKVLLIRYNEMNGSSHKHNAIVQRMATLYRSVVSTAGKIGKGIMNATNAVSGLIGSIKKLGHATKSTNALSQISFKKLTRTVLKYGFGIRSTFILFRKLKATVKEDFKIMANDIPAFGKQIEGLKSSFQILKYSLGSAFEPIASIAIPYLIKLMDYLSTFFDMLGQLSAAIFGQKQYVKVMKQTATATEKAADATKGYLSPIDTIHQYTKDKNSGSSNSGASGVYKLENVSEEAIGIAAKFQEFVDKIMVATKPFREALKKLWDEGLSKLANFVWTGLKDFYEHFLVPIGKWAFGEDTGLTRLVNLVNQFLNDIHWDEINKALVDFWDALAPYATEFGEGLIDFFEDCLDFVKDNVINKIPDFLNGVTDALNKGNPEDARTWGYNLAKFALGIWAIIKVAKLASFIGGLITKLGLLAKVAIILGTIDIGWRFGNWLYELFTGEHSDLSPLEQLQAILQDFASGHYKDTFAEMGASFVDNIQLGLKVIGSWLLATADKLISFLKQFPGISSQVDLDAWQASVRETEKGWAELAAKDWHQLTYNTLRTREETKPAEKEQQQKKYTYTPGKGLQEVIDKTKELNTEVEKVGNTIQASGEKASTTLGNTETDIDTNTQASLELDNILAQLGNTTAGLGTNADDSFDTFETSFSDLMKAISGDDTLDYLDKDISALGDTSEEVKDTITSNWTIVTGDLQGPEPFNTLDTNFANLETDATTATDTISKQWKVVSTDLQGPEPWDYLDGVLSEETFNGYGEHIVGGLVTNGMSAAAQEIGSIKDEVFKEENWKMDGVSKGMEASFNGGIDLIKAGWNAFAEWVESHISFDILSGINPALAQTIKATVGSDIKLKIPRLAQGAVIPPNRQFLAMLGDQKSGTNIEAPLETIKQAMREVVGQRGNGGTTTVNLTLNGRQLAQAVIQEGKVIKATSGNNIFDI